MEKQHGIEIWINDVRVTLTADNRPLRDILQILLEPMAMACLIEDDVMKLTSQSCLETKFETRVYPVGDLMTTAEEADQLLETIECGLGIPRKAGSARWLAVSSRMKTLTVTATYAEQVRARRLLRALRDAQQASVNPQRDTRVKP